MSCSKVILFSILSLLITVGIFAGDQPAKKYLSPDWIKEVINRQMERDLNHKLNQKDLDGITTLKLYFNPEDIEVARHEALKFDTLSLKYLINLKNLQELEIYAEKISDLSTLTKLKHLKKLGLEYSKIVAPEGVVVLKGSATLRELSVNQRNAVFDAANLMGIEQLERLSLSKSKNISSLKDLKKLKELRLKEGVVDISFLKVFKEIEVLNLFGNKIVDISPLKELKKLRKLYLNSPEITALTPLKDLSNLDELTLCGPGESDDDFIDLDKFLMHRNGNMRTQLLSH